MVEAGGIMLGWSEWGQVRTRRVRNRGCLGGMMGNRGCESDNLPAELNALIPARSMLPPPFDRGSTKVGATGMYGHGDDRLARNWWW